MYTLTERPEAARQTCEHEQEKESELQVQTNNQAEAKRKPANAMQHYLAGSGFYPPGVYQLPYNQA
eukprot:658214-Prymnesium_polylepis.2